MDKSEREQKMEAKYGGPEALKAKRREWQAKSRLHYNGNGGLRSMSTEKRKAISKLGNQARWGKHENENHTTTQEAS